MTDPTKGVLAMVAACVIWGLSPLYYKAIEHVPPMEILCHRTIWSLVLFGILLLLQTRSLEVVRLLGNPKAFLTAFAAAVLISLNWYLYIFAIQIGRTVESSLGYYIFPLVAVLLGMIIFQERLTTSKWISLGIALIAVVTLTLGLGAAPWISLALAITFGFYGVLKKWSGAGPVVSVTTEVLILAPLALLWLVGVHNGMGPNETGTFGHSVRDSLILILSGPLTAGPLILFSYASKRIRLSTLGLVQYLNPSLQFLCAVAVFGEVFTVWHGVAFPLIWIALAIFSYDAIRQD